MLQVATAALAVALLALTGTAAARSTQALVVKPGVAGVGPVAHPLPFTKGTKYLVSVSGTIVHTYELSNPPTRQERDAFYCFRGCGGGVQWGPSLTVNYLAGSRQPVHAYDSTKNNAAPKYKSSHVYNFVYDEAQGRLTFAATPFDPQGKYIRPEDNYTGSFTVSIQPAASPILRGTVNVALDLGSFKPASLQVYDGTQLRICNRGRTLHKVFSISPGNRFGPVVLKAGACVTTRLRNATKLPLSVRYFDELHAAERLVVVVYPG